MGWLLHFFGLDSASGTAYLAWSGAGGDVAELAIIGAILGGWHRVNCHTKGCWRIGRQRVEGTTYVCCRKHHPDGKPSHHHILAMHREHQAAKEAHGEHRRL